MFSRAETAPSTPLTGLARYVEKDGLDALLEKIRGARKMGGRYAGCLTNGESVVAWCAHLCFLGTVGLSASTVVTRPGEETGGGRREKRGDTLYWLPCTYWAVVRDAE